MKFLSRDLFCFSESTVWSLENILFSKPSSASFGTFWTVEFLIQKNLFQFFLVGQTYPWSSLLQLWSCSIFHRDILWHWSFRVMIFSHFWIILLIFRIHLILEAFFGFVWSFSFSNCEFLKRKNLFKFSSSQLWSCSTFSQDTSWDFSDNFTIMVRILKSETGRMENRHLNAKC